MPDANLDLLVLGSGVAGLSAAVRASGVHGMRVGVVTKAELPDSATRWAQGGVAAVLGGEGDSTDLHLADTLAAGAGLCDVDAVRVLVEEASARVSELMAMGATFDRDRAGRLELAREGGHSLARILHAGGSATGAEVERALVESVRSTAAVLHEDVFALDLVVEAGRCRGVAVLFADGSVRTVLASNVLVATGGAGQLYSVTTSPLEATGDGIAMALRAGAAVADVEFVQFHPTALSVDTMPRPLLTEALRGHGAVLRDTNGIRFVDEMQPRDVVSRAEAWRMQELGTDHVFLDVTELEDFGRRFPNIAADLAAAGLDPASDWLPVAPAAHYTCGGIVTDLNGATSMPGLWAAGEVSCTGVHGANRLASNSLLEGLVFGPRAVEAIAAGVEAAEATGAMRSVYGYDDSARRDGEPPIGGARIELPRGPGPLASPLGDAEVAAARRSLQRTLTDNAGVIRDADRLAVASKAIDAVREAGVARTVAANELSNLATVAAAVVAAARIREESRGAHTRDDFPETDPAFHHRLVIG